MGTVYATQAQLQSLAINEKQLASIAPEDVTTALQAASGQIDSYLGRVFNLPLTAFGIELTQACAQIAAYHLLSVRGWNPGTEQAQTVRDRYNDAVKWLNDIAVGRAKPSWPDTKSKEAFNPTSPAVVLAPSQGGIGIAGGSFQDSLDARDGGNCSPVGTPGRPRQRGW